MPSLPRSDSASFLRPELIASWREIAGVLFCLLVPFAAGSAVAAWHGSPSHYFETFLSNRTLLLNGAFEGALLGLGLIYLHRRGWIPADLKIRPGVGGCLQGIALVPLVLVANGAMVFALFWIMFSSQHHYATFAGFLIAYSPQLSHIHVDVAWSVLVVAMVLNAFLEEIVCTAYAFNQFAAKLGGARGLLLIVSLRTACHSYQGFVHALGIGAVFLIFGLWYWRTRNLWTLIFAHSLLDLSSLSLLKLMSH